MLLHNTSAKTKITAILFDLDGTLLDTAPDLANALNHILIAKKIEPLPVTAIRSVISEGAAGLLKLGLNISTHDSEYSQTHEQLIDYYSQHICHQTQLFPGVTTLLHYLEKNNIPWGIVTNKSTSLTSQLINSFPLLKKAKCIIAGDTLEYNKPHPKPLLHASECMQQAPENCLYVGDAQRDIKSAKAAGMLSAVALYGYINKKTNPKRWEANLMFNSPLELIVWLKTFR
jgi:N-acetyl-D-muramate 6-phosphate phosphatase